MRNMEFAKVKLGWLMVVCSLVFATVTITSPPALMDDVDSVTAQIARNMVTSGDWVTPRLNGIAYFEKPALRFWMVASAYLLFGVHDWAARIPMALSAVALCWLVVGIGRWAFGRNQDSERGWLSGIILLTCVGLFLFTRILLPDVTLTLTTTLAMWAMLRILDDDTTQTSRWAVLLGLSFGAGFMLKGLVAWVFPVGTSLVYLLVSRRLFDWPMWRRAHLWLIALVILIVCLPWVTLAILRNPPYFDFTMRSEPGQYHGFFWFFFFNEHLFRYLNLRYPRDYNTVPRLAFWLYHLLWLFPWSFYFPLIARASFDRKERAGRVRLFCLCWIGWTLLFFTFSTTQEYYSMPCYPALALLLGDAIHTHRNRVALPTYITGAMAGAAAMACCVILWLVRNENASGDIAAAMNYQVSTLSLGKAQDITLQTMAWLRVPLVFAAIGFALGGLLAAWRKGKYAFIGFALMMLVFVNAARLAMVTLNPYFGSRALAEALLTAPPGQLIVDDQYYSFSSVFFYANRTALLLNGRKMNLEYGSHAPTAPNVFINDQDMAGRWFQPERHYLTVAAGELTRINALVGANQLHVMRSSGGKLLLTNQPLPGTQTVAELAYQQR